MTTLSSLLVARRVATIAQVDEALARQVVRGGDLGTCLLELRAVTEADLVPVLAEAFGREPAGVGELPIAFASVLRLVPRAVALRYGIYPLEEKDGELRVAVFEPLPQAVEDDLGFALGAHLRQYAAPLVRIRQAIARDYGLPLDRRFLRLLAKLDGRADPSPSDRPPRGHDTEPSSRPAAMRVSKTGTVIMAAPGVPPSSPPDPESSQTQNPIAAPAARRRTWPGMLGPSSDEPQSVTSVSVPDATPVSPLPPGTNDPVTPESVTPADKRVSAPPPADFVTEAMAVTAAQVERKRRVRAENAPSKALLGWARRTLGNTIPNDAAGPRRRGPLTASEAERGLEAASTGERALAVFFAFSRQFFEYAALFVVNGDLAAGHDAWGPGASREKVRTIGVALDLPSFLSQAKRRGTPTLLRLKRSGLDGDLRNDLKRHPPREVLVLPVMMRGRCVALLYGDDGDHPVAYAEIGDVVAMAGLLSSTLERILLRKKRAALRDTSTLKSKRGEAVDRTMISPSDPGRPPSPDEGLGDVVDKRGVWSEEDIVDEGWTMPPDVEATGAQRKATPVQVRKGKPIAREEPDDNATEVIISDAEDQSLMNELLDQIEQNPSPSPAGVAKAKALEREKDNEASRARDPLASASFSAGPHPPPPPSQGLVRALPSVLIRSDLVDHVIAGGERADRALGEILALGEAAIPSVFARFPGPLTVDRNQALGELPRPSDCGPVLRIVAAMRRLALPFLAVRSGDSDVEVRFWATYLLGELNYADAATALLPRLFDENPTVRRIAVRSARSLVAAGDESLPLRKNLERMVGYAGEPVQRRLIALSTIGELRLYRSIPVLIEVLSDPTDAVVEGSLRALVAMTRQELGRDARKWSEWWETKGKKRLA